MHSIRSLFSNWTADQAVTITYGGRSRTTEKVVGGV